MRTLPSCGWGPWRCEWYSYSSSPRRSSPEDGFGIWRNVWLSAIGAFVYERWPEFWRWQANTPLLRWFHWRSRRSLQKHFPNLRM